MTLVGTEQAGAQRVHHVADRQVGVRTVGLRQLDEVEDEGGHDRAHPQRERHEVGRNAGHTACRNSDQNFKNFFQSVAA